MEGKMRKMGKSALHQKWNAVQQMNITEVYS